MMNPKILRPEEFKDTLNKLVRFYQSKPQEYLSLSRSSEYFQSYAKSVAEFGGSKKASVLDFGSGSWHGPAAIAEEGFEKVVGLDYFSEDHFRDFKENCNNPGVSLALNTSDKFPFEDESFDVITSSCVFEHIIYVDRILNEMDRVLKPGGTLMIHCPNWSSFNISAEAFIKNLIKRDRFWRYDSVMGSFFGIFRTFAWYFKVFFASKPKFIMIHPRQKGGEIDFERTDDDVVHVCQPLSFKKYFKSKGYEIVKYNRGSGRTPYSKLINNLMPSFSTTNEIVARKNNK